MLLSIAMITSCGDDESCSDGIQNGNETGIDCGGDCNPCETTVEEDKANIQKTFDDLLMCTQDIKDSRAVTVLFKNFLNMSDGEALNEDWISDLSEELEDVVDVQHIEDNSRLDLAYHAGTHIYDATSETWSKTNDVSDRMIFNFPASPTATTNNVELVMDMYEDKMVTIDNEEMFLPTAMHAAMNIDGIRTFEITVSKVTYADNAGYQLPVEIEAELFMDPMEMSISVLRGTTTFYQGDIEFSDGNLCDIEMRVQLELEDDDFENLTEESIKTLGVRVNVGKLSIETLGDIATLITLDDPTDTQVNNLLDLDVLFDNMKIADLEVNQDMETVIIFYKDGTSEDSSVFYEGFLDDLEAIWTEFFG